MAPSATLFAAVLRGPMIFRRFLIPGAWNLFPGAWNRAALHLDARVAWRRWATAALLAVGPSACASPSPEGPGRTTAPVPPPLDDATTVDAGLDASATDATPVDGASRDEGPEPPRGPRLVELGYRVDKVYREPRHTWRQVATLHWQAVADDLPPLPAAAARVIPASGCAAGMMRVEGGLLLDEKGRDDTDKVLEAQDRTCERWRVPKRVCESFSEAKWSTLAASLPRRAMRFCMDRYEYPNRLGEYPLVVTTFSESEAFCKKEGKRLCTESEWTFACEGEEGRPYPYGYTRDATACPIDRPRVEPPEGTFAPRTTGHTARGIDAMWQGERSGAFSRCTSPFGVADMTGNVDEWTRSTRPWGYRMILKGGHWSYVRARCRPQTRGHGPLYVNVETGFRCCTDGPP